MTDPSFTETERRRITSILTGRVRAHRRKLRKYRRRAGDTPEEFEAFLRQSQEYSDVIASACLKLGCEPYHLDPDYKP